MSSRARDANGLDARLGPDLAALIRAWPAPLAAITELTSLPSPVRRRASFRVDFTDGTRLKGRRFNTGERAQRVESLLRSMRDGFPRVLAMRGDSLLLEWVEGAVLDSLQPIPADALVAAGELLGALHQREPDAPVPGNPAEWIAKLKKDAAVLVAAGALAPELARTLIDAAAAGVPSAATCGVIHKDFCAANVVLRATKPVSIDNANLALGPHDFDLARTWYRWPMQPGEWQQFTCGYQRHRGLKSFLAHFVFWSTAVLVGSASTRIRAGSSQAQVPLERLHLLGELLRGSADADPAAFGWPQGAPLPRGAVSR